MKHIKLTLTLCIITVAMISSGQDYAFKVLVNKGKSEVKSGASWQPVKTGTSLKSADEIRVPENSYVGLIHVSGKPLEVKQAGKYKVVDLAGKVSGGSSVLNKYTDFILSANEGKKNNLAATGAVHRGLGEVKVYLPPTESAIVFNDKVIVNWEADKVSGTSYEVVFSSMFGDELKRIKTSDIRVMIDLNDNSFSNEDNILVDVISKADVNRKSESYTLKKLSKADKERIKNLLTEITAQTSGENALNKLILAGFYEENNLFIDAITAYQEAIQLAPDVTAYKETYNDFLIRNGIKELPSGK